MKLLSLLKRGTLVLLAIELCGAGHTALADTYVVYQLSDANDHNLIGITEGGDVVISDLLCGSNPSVPCYSTYLNGVAVGGSATAPSFTYDDGTACGSSPAGFSVTHSVCNNGRIGFQGDSNPNGDPDGVYAGLFSSPTKLVTSPTFYEMGGLAGEDLNSSGDFVWIDARDEFIFEAVDTSVAATPEPSSLLLLGTGILSVAGGMVRRAKLRMVK